MTKNEASVTETSEVPEHLLPLLLRSQDDEDAVRILHDAMVEAGWRPKHPFLMPLALGMTVAPAHPGQMNTDQIEAWDRLVAERDAAADRAWDFIAGRSRDWARAILATVLFGGWATPMRATPYPSSTRSPWSVVRRQALAQSRPYRARAAERRRASEAREDLAPRAHGHIGVSR